MFILFLSHSSLVFCLPSRFVPVWSAQGPLPFHFNIRHPFKLGPSTLLLRLGLGFVPSLIQPTSSLCRAVSTISTFPIESSSCSSFSLKDVARERTPRPLTPVSRYHQATLEIASPAVSYHQSSHRLQLTISWDVHP